MRNDGEENEQQQERAPYKKRTRNGCQRCKTRRRKCDEGKPQCQRCIEAGVMCDYQSPLRFRNKHSYHSAQAEAETSEQLEVPRNYTNEQAEPLEPTSVSDTERTVLLLNHYRRHLAPWLDICDPERSFGNLIFQLGPPLLDAVLELAAVSSGLKSITPKAPYNSLSLFMALGNLPQLESHLALQFAIIFTLKQLQQFVRAIPDTWKALFPLNGVPPDFVSHQMQTGDQQRIWLAVAGLMTRMGTSHNSFDVMYTRPGSNADTLWTIEIAFALMTETAPSLKSEALLDCLANSNSRPDILSISKHTNVYFECLAFVVDAARHCFEPVQNAATNTDPLACVPQPVDWSSLMAKLHHWYANRQPAFAPILDEDDPIMFPKILFMDDAAASANLLYHAALYILLRRRAKDGQRQDMTRTESVGRTQMVPLWHARRVCGIALTSDQHFWDPCTIAAFFNVAQHMTHPTQQQALLAGFERIRSRGWRICGLVKRLREEWLFPEA